MMVHKDNQHQLGIILALILVGLNLRPTMAAIGPLMLFIRTDIPLSFTAVSLLTMLPVLAMGLAMFVITPILRRFKVFNVVAVALVVIGLSNLMRLYAVDYLNLVITAVTAGCGIAIIQAVIPIMIKKNFPNAIALYMGLYVTAIMGGAALAASLAALLQELSGRWQVALACWSSLAAVALAMWFYIKASVQTVNQQMSRLNSSGKFFHIPRAWSLCLFFGLGTASYTCVLAWLPPYYIEYNWSSTNAGLLLALLTATEVVAGLVFPSLANRSVDRRAILAIILVLMISGYVGLIFAPTLAPIVWACLLGLGIGGLFPMSLVVTMDHYDDPQNSGELTAFVQGGGYVIAAFSPLIAGMIRDQTQSFTASWGVLLAITCVLLLMTYIFNPKTYRAKMP